MPHNTAGVFWAITQLGTECTCMSVLLATATIHPMEDWSIQLACIAGAFIGTVAASLMRIIHKKPYDFKTDMARHVLNLIAGPVFLCVVLPFVESHLNVGTAFGFTAVLSSIGHLMFEDVKTFGPPAIVAKVKKFLEK